MLKLNSPYYFENAGKITLKANTDFIEPLLWKYKCRFCKGFTNEHCLKIFGDFFTQLPKTFQSLKHKLIIAKLNAYNFSLPALKLMQQSYLLNNKQCTKMNLVYGVPQKPVLGQIFSNIFFVLFFVKHSTDFANNTYINERIGEAISKLPELPKWLL